MRIVYLFEASKLAVTTVLLFTFFAWSCQSDDELPVTPQAVSPLVSAGADKVIRLPLSSVLLNGIVSDSDGIVKSQYWKLVSGPNTPTLSHIESTDLSVSNLIEGNYVFRLSAIDDTELSSTDEVFVIVTPELMDPLASKITKVTYSSNDFQTWDYDTEGKLMKYYAQWQYVQNDPSVIQKLAYYFHYDKSKKLIQTTLENGGHPINYYYNKYGVLEKTEELNYKNEVAVRRFYTFEGSRLKEERWETTISSGDSGHYIIRFEYDNKGNMVKRTTLVPEDSDSSYKVDDTTEYTDFDDKKNPDNLMLHYPHLPEITLQVNNPGKKIFKLANGTVISTEVLTYQYGINGYPYQKKRKLFSNGVSSELIGVYSYQ